MSATTERYRLAPGTPGLAHDVLLDRAVSVRVVDTEAPERLSRELRLHRRSPWGPVLDAVVLQGRVLVVTPVEDAAPVQVQAAPAAPAAPSASPTEATVEVEAVVGHVPTLARTAHLLRHHLADLDRHGEGEASDGALALMQKLDDASAEPRADAGVVRHPRPGRDEDPELRRSRAVGLAGVGVLVAVGVLVSIVAMASLF